VSSAARYSAASRLLRSLSAASQSVCSKPRLAPVPAFPWRLAPKSFRARRVRAFAIRDLPFRRAGQGQPPKGRSRSSCPKLVIAANV